MAENINEVIDKMVKLRKEFRELYTKTGLISVESEYGIHVRKEFFDILPGKPTVKKKYDGMTYPYEVSKVIENTKFFYVAKEV